MFSMNPFRASHELIHDVRTLPAEGGLSLVFSHFDGYFPILDGSVRVEESSNAGGDEKSGSIGVTIKVRASSPAYKDKIRIHQEESEISISTGGLSLVSSLVAPRLHMEVFITLPPSIGNLSIKSLSLPIKGVTIPRANDVVIHTKSSSISVSKISARSLTVSSHSGSITIESGSKQEADVFTKVSNHSASTQILSSITTPTLSVSTHSGSLSLDLATTATDLKVRNFSGALSGEVEYLDDKVSASEFENHSGSTNVKMSGWTGFLTAENGSGSLNVGGKGLERYNEGWRKGSGASTAAFKSQSGSLKVEVL